MYYYLFDKKRGVKRYRFSVGHEQIYLSRDTVPLNTYFNCVLVRGLSTAVPPSAIIYLSRGTVPLPILIVSLSVDCPLLFRCRPLLFETVEQVLEILNHKYFPNMQQYTNIREKPYTLKRKSHFYIPFMGIARTPSRFPHSCVCERFIYSQDRLTFLQQNADRSWEYISRSQTHECGNWDCGRACNSFSGNICFKFSVLVLCSADAQVPECLNRNHCTIHVLFAT